MLKDLATIPKVEGSSKLSWFKFNFCNMSTCKVFSAIFVLPVNHLYYYFKPVFLRPLIFSIFVFKRNFRSVL